MEYAGLPSFHSVICDAERSRTYSSYFQATEDIPVLTKVHPELNSWMVLDAVNQSAYRATVEPFCIWIIPLYEPLLHPSRRKIIRMVKSVSTVCVGIFASTYEFEPFSNAPRFSFPGAYVTEFAVPLFPFAASFAFPLNGYFATRAMFPRLGIRDYGFRVRSLPGRACGRGATERYPASGFDGRGIRCVGSRRVVRGQVNGGSEEVHRARVDSVRGSPAGLVDVERGGRSSTLRRESYEEPDVRYGDGRAGVVVPEDALVIGSVGDEFARNPDSDLFRSSGRYRPRPVRGKVV